MTIKPTVINFCYSFLKMDVLTVKENMRQISVTSPPNSFCFI